MNRAVLTKLHLIAAAFMFPAVLMFLVTGGLYTWGNKGEWVETTHLVPLTQPFETQDEAGLKAMAQTALAVDGVALPSGSASLTGHGAQQSMSWVGARSEVAVSLAEDPAMAQVVVKEATLHRWLVQLHKAKGSVWFKVYASALAIVLFMLVASGLIMGLQIRSLRRITVISGLSGAVAFTGFVLMG